MSSRVGLRRIIVVAKLHCPRPYWWTLVLCSLASSCGGPIRSPAGDYLGDAAYRRSELEASLVNPQNNYSELRLQHYATRTAADWDRLPEWNPAVEPIAATDLDGPEGAVALPLTAAADALSIPDDTRALDDPELVALGKTAFARYPAQLAPYLSVALGSATAARSHGLWIDESRGVGGLVRARMADGSAQIALTCSSCHAEQAASGIEDGRSNAELDLGAAIVEASRASIDPETAGRIATWGAGRLDVTTNNGGEPARIADLRPVRWQTNLQQDATLRMRNRTTLAIRIETLLITSSGQVVRPPRVVTLALAAYLLTLGETLPAATAAEAASPGGVRVFAQHCASCHAPPAFSGPPVSLESVGTDPTLGLSSDRGTSMYRVPSLRGVGTRGPLLHDGTVPTLNAMFDPARTSPAFTNRLHGVGAVPGHPFGLDLDDSERSALFAYLGAL